MPEHIEKTLIGSSRRRRIAAFSIDNFVMAFLMVAAIFLALGPHFFDDSDPVRMLIIMLAVMIPGFFLTFARDSIKGISIGRWITGIMVRDDADFNSTPSFGKMFIRNLFLMIWPVEFILLASSKEKKRLGDKITGTIVLKNPNRPGKLPRILVLVVLGIALWGFVFLFAEYAIKNSDAYKVAIQNIEANKEIVAETGGITGYGMMSTGNVDITNGYGHAQLQIEVLGKIKDISVSVSLEKKPHGEWTLIKMNE